MGSYAVPSLGSTFTCRQYVLRPFARRTLSPGVRRAKCRRTYCLHVNVFACFPGVLQANLGLGQRRFHQPRLFKQRRANTCASNVSRGSAPGERTRRASAGRACRRTYCLHLSVALDLVDSSFLRVHLEQLADCHSFMHVESATAFWVMLYVKR